MRGIMSFGEWQGHMVRITENDSVVDCPECHGDGCTLETCCECGSEKEVDCELCETSGKVVFGELEIAEQMRCFTSTEYRCQVLKDIDMMADWSGVRNVDVANRYGMALCSRMFNRTVDFVRLSGEQTYRA